MLSLPVNETNAQNTTPNTVVTMTPTDGQITGSSSVSTTNSNASTGTISNITSSGAVLTFQPPASTIGIDMPPNQYIITDNGNILTTAISKNATVTTSITGLTPNSSHSIQVLLNNSPILSGTFQTLPEIQAVAASKPNYLMWGAIAVVGYLILRKKEK